MAIATMGEMIYLMISVVTGNWASAFTSIGAYVLLLLVIYFSGLLLKGMGLC